MSDRRDRGIDLARGLAVLLMVQTHAYGAWVSTEGKASWLYALTRLLGAIPAPLFVLLAGVGAYHSAEVMRSRGASLREIRAAITVRGLRTIAYGYGLSVALALLEGRAPELETLLRADILHCIGLSMVVVAWTCLAREETTQRALGIVATGLLAAFTAARLPLEALPLPARAALALLVDVPGLTRFPVAPLAGFAALGVALAEGRALGKDAPEGAKKIGEREGARRRALSALVIASATAAAAAWSTNLSVALLGGPLSRAHPGLIFNFMDGGARAMATVAVARLLTSVEGAGRVRQILSRFGQHSLFAYAVHLPLCYGRWSAPIAGSLDFGTATVGVILLCAGVYGAIGAKRWVGARIPRRGP